MENKEKMFVVGDIHGNPVIMSSKNFPEGKDLSIDDVVVQLGDFGIIWEDKIDAPENHWMEWLSDKPFTVLVVPGNHENFNRIFDLPIIEKWGGKVREYKTYRNSIYFAERGEVYTIGTRKILTIGGALSIDKEYRTLDVSYWTQELLSKADEENTLNNLDLNNWKVDYVFAHTCPQEVVPYMIDGPLFDSPKYMDPTCKFLDFVTNRLDFQEYHFGHFHTDRDHTDAGGDKYFCSYYKIREIK